MVALGRNILILLTLNLWLSGLGFCQSGSSYTFRPIIGSGSRGDGGAATSALLDGPYGVAQDSQGNVYISESNAGVIRRVGTNGIIQRFAGSGVQDDGAQGQPALQTDLISPGSLLIDTDGGLIFADTGACRIRKVLVGGTIEDLVGTGRCAGSSGGFPGSNTLTGNVPPLQTDIGPVGGMVEDASGELIFSDPNENVVWMLNSTGTLVLIAGTGYASFGGDSSTATSAYLHAPRGLAIDSDGNIYIADSANCRIRQIDTSGTITTVAGNSSCSGVSPTWNGTSLGALNGLAYDKASDSIYISSPGLARVLQFKVGTAGLSKFVGDGTIGATVSAPALQYPLAAPGDIIVSGSTVLIADSTAFRVLQVQANNVTAFAGMWPQLASYNSASTAPLLRPSGLCFKPDGSLLAIDSGTGRIVRFTTPNELTAFAGAQYPTGYSAGDGGPAVLAELDNPVRIACAPNGNVYVAEASDIRVIDSQGTIQTQVAALNISGEVSSLGATTGLAVDSAGRLVFSQGDLNEVFRYDPNTRSMSVIAGTGVAGYQGDGSAATSALLDSPGDLVYDSKGNLYIADRGNGAVREVSTNGTIETIAGAYYGFSYSNISGSPATSVSLGTIEGLAIDSNNQIYIAETSRVSVIKSDGNIYVIGGFEAETDTGLVSYVAQPLYGCNGLTTDSNNRVYFSVDQLSQVFMALPPGDPGPPPGIDGVISASAFGAFTSAAPGSWVEIYGGNLASDTRGWTTADFSGNLAPTSLDGTSVSVAGYPAYVSYISPTQVNVQIPSTVQSGTQALTVTTAAGTSSSYELQINSIDPGLFAPSIFLIDGNQYVGALLSDGSTYVLPSDAVSGVTSRPAQPGETITLYGVGFGSVNPQINAGVIVQGQNTLSQQIQIFLNKVPATVTYAGLAPGEVGLYQFNVVVPSGVQGDAVPITFSAGSVMGTQVLYTAISN